MATSESQMEDLIASRTYHAINRSIEALNIEEMEQEHAISVATSAERVRKLVTVYAAVKPLLTVISTLPLLPQVWRAAVALLVTALNAIVSSPELNPDFKAGKNL